MPSVLRTYSKLFIKDGSILSAVLGAPEWDPPPPQADTKSAPMMNTDLDFVFIFSPRFGSDFRFRAAINVQTDGHTELAL
jgi:hypothetical protein